MPPAGSGPPATCSTARPRPWSPPPRPPRRPPSTPGRRPGPRCSSASRRRPGWTSTTWSGRWGSGGCWSCWSRAGRGSRPACGRPGWPTGWSGTWPRWPSAGRAPRGCWARGRPPWPTPAGCAWPRWTASATTCGWSRIRDRPVGPNASPRTPPTRASREDADVHRDHRGHRRRGRPGRRRRRQRGPPGGRGALAGRAAGARRVGGRERLLCDRGPGDRGRVRGRAGRRDPAPHRPGRPGRRRPGQPGTPHGPGRPPRRRPGPGPRRRGGEGPGPDAGGRGRGGPGRATSAPRTLCGREGVGGGRRGQPDRGRGRARLVRGRPGAPHPEGHHPGPAPPRGPGAAGGRRGRQVRRAAGAALGRPGRCPVTGFAAVEDALAAMAAGGMVVVVDDADRENEGDLIMAAEAATPETIGFFVRHTSGVICTPMLGERLDELDLPLMVAANTAPYRTAFTVSVDARAGTTTGISAADRATTIQALIDPATRPADLVRPGHIFPLRYREGGVLKRAGHTEAAVDLARLAGRAPAAVLCEIVDDSGQMARLPQLERFAATHGLPLISIADLIRSRRQHEKLVKRVAEARIPTRWGDFTAYAYESLLDGEQHLALVKGAVQGEEDVLVRVHSECLTGDALGSLRCDCGPQLEDALARIAQEGLGVVVYLRGHEGRGIGLGHKLRAYSLQEQGRDTVDANLDLGLPVDGREYGIGSQILVDLGVTTMRLLTNNPAKYGGLDGFGLQIVERVPLQTRPNPENLRYLRTKRERTGHLLELPGDKEGGGSGGLEPSPPVDRGSGGLEPSPP